MKRREMPDCNDRSGPNGRRPRRRVLRAGLFAGLLVALVAGCAAVPPIPPTTHMPQSEIVVPVARWTSLPAGYDSGVVALTPARWKELVTVNHAVDHEIAYELEPGEARVWALPKNNRGDCVSIALEKMKRLLDRGWPRNALRIGVVWPLGKKETHAVLTVETDVGTFVLDRLQGVWPIAWKAGRYFWIAREYPESGTVMWEYFSGQPTGSLPLPSCG